MNEPRPAYLMIAKEAVVAEHLSFLNVIVLSIGSTSAVDDPRFRICTKRDNDKVESLLRDNSTIISVKSYRPYPSIACLILQFSAIRWLPYLDAEEVAVQKDVNALLAKQQADGGWSQTDDMTSDAYATGTVLTALQAVGRLPGDHPAAGRWYVARRDTCQTDSVIL